LSSYKLLKDIPERKAGTIFVPGKSHSIKGYPILITGKYYWSAEAKGGTIKVAEELFN
jgi:hypothetical protein